MRALLPLMFLLIVGCPADEPLSSGAQPESVVPLQELEDRQRVQRGVIETMKFEYVHMIGQDGPSKQDAEKLQALQEDGWRVSNTEEDVLLVNAAADGKLNLKPSMVRVTLTLEREWN